jgi:hypothetical protein
MKINYEYKVKYDVSQRGYNQEDQRGKGIPQRCENTGTDIIQKDK